jgi:MSHA pilin protein MshC
MNVADLPDMDFHAQTQRHPTRLRCRQSRAGFTIVELIVVIVLLGILSISAMSRFVRPSAFAPGIVSHAIIAQARAAAQLAASRADAQVTLVVDRIGVDWRLRVQTDLDGVVNSELVGAHNTSIQASSGAASGTIDATTPLIVQFDHAGNLSSVMIGAGAGSAAAGVAMVLSGDSSREACIYPTGYVADAGCE